MDEQQHLPKQKHNYTMLSIMLSALAIVIGVALLYALAASSSTIAQVLAFLLILVAFVVFAYVGVRYLMRDR